MSIIQHHNSGTLGDFGHFHNWSYTELVTQSLGVHLEIMLIGLVFCVARSKCVWRNHILKFATSIFEVLYSTTSSLILQILSFRWSSPSVTTYIMSLDNDECKLQLNCYVGAYNQNMVIIVLLQWISYTSCHCYL